MSVPSPETDPAAPRFLDAGEAALVVEFGRQVDPATSERVFALDDALRVASPEGLRETVPTYRSLMIHYDPLALGRAALVDHVRPLLRRAKATPRVGSVWMLPCCYDPALGEDIAEAAVLADVSVEDLIALHAGADYRVYMYGFAPGFAYLGGLPERLALPRRMSPRAPHPRNAIMIGGGLAAVASVPMPTGWYVVGRTPERLYAPERDPAFLVEGGDTLRFEAVDGATFAELDRRAAAGESVARKAS